MPLSRLREPFDDPECFFELKYDGFRALAYVLGGKPRLVSRNGRDFKRFDNLRDELELEINADAAVLDGEICCLDESGQSQSRALSARSGLIPPPAPAGGWRFWTAARFQGNSPRL